MNDRKFRLTVCLAAVLVLLSPVIPFALTFGGGMADTAAVAFPAPEDAAPLRGIVNPDTEMRGLWIATVSNINFPSKTGLSAEKLAEELDSIVAFAEENGFNAIFFQARPAADALYASKLFPPSRFVSGTAGKAPDKNFDCLGYLVEKAHDRQIAVHAWVNPLRVTTGSAANPQTDPTALPADSPAAVHPEYTVAYADGKLYFNAGIPEVRQLVADGVREICENYAVDGIVFDDYFYPYPVSGATFDDAAAYAAYGGAYADIGDFRRASVNALVKLCYETVKEVRPTLRFGVSPFGIWQNNDGANGGSVTRGLSAYDAIYCDALAWVEGGYVDYLAPQIYWTFETASAPYGVLADWWNRALDGSGVDLYVCHGVYRYADGKMASGELTKQVEYARDLYAYRGGLYYGYAALETNAGGATDEVKDLFAKTRIYSDYVDDGRRLTVDSYADGDRLSGEAALITGESNLAYPISVNGITPLRKKDGTYAITLALAVGANRITVQNGEERIELILIREK